VLSLRKNKNEYPPKKPQNKKIKQNSQKEHREKKNIAKPASLSSLRLSVDKLGGVQVNAPLLLSAIGARTDIARTLPHVAE
jgi:hypothetical protein